MKEGKGKKKTSQQTMLTHTKDKGDKGALQSDNNGVGRFV